MEEISSLHSELVSLPALPSQAIRAYNSAKKMDACLLGASMDADTLSSKVEITAERSTALLHSYKNLLCSSASIAHHCNLS